MTPAAQDRSISNGRRRVRPLFQLLLLAIAVSSSHVFAQDRCFTPDEIRKLTEQLSSNAEVSFNNKLSKELLSMKSKEQMHVQNSVRENETDDKLKKIMISAREKNEEHLCALLKQYGWPTRRLVGDEAAGAAFFLLRNDSSAQLQLDLLPVVVAAVKKEEISRSAFAAYIDRLRLNSGLKQLFGTQATILNGFLVLYPIEAEAQVDLRRKEFQLPPLKEYLRSLETFYRLPLMKSTGALTNKFSESAKNSVASATSGALFGSDDKDDLEVVRVDTNLVSVNVSVYSSQLRTQVSKLGQSDFTITEDGHPQTISFFAATDVPFDLVLLIDLSGSTADKRDLIRKSTRRFIEAARPADRIAVITFADEVQVISPLTEDRSKLLESIKKIEGGGGSNVWDALKFTLDKVLGPGPSTHRRAVVFMTDGVDNALGGRDEGSVIPFSDLLETVRKSDALIVPIYLDTESGYRGDVFKRSYENARKTLAMLAEESGGLYYKARKVEDLDGVYQQVIDDLGKVYSLGYRSTNERRDGSWRAVQIEIPTHPELKTRARPGYYAH